MREGGREGEGEREGKRGRGDVLRFHLPRHLRFKVMIVDDVDRDRHVSLTIVLLQDLIDFKANDSHRLPVECPNNILWE